MKKAVRFSSHAWLDYIHWKKSNKYIVDTIDDYIQEILDSPFEGRGYPQPLSYDLGDIWCRRINLTHRLLYTITDREVLVIQCRYHF